MTDNYLPSTSYQGLARIADAGGSRSPCALVMPPRSNDRAPMSNPSEIAAEFIAALMWKCMTHEELSEYTGASRDAVGRWLKAFHRSGVIRVSEYVSNRAQGRRARRWALQRIPFGLPDAEKQ